MKKLLLFVWALLPAITFAQVTEGQVEYTETSKMTIKLPDEMKHMEDKLPKSMSSSLVLFFNAGQSLYKPVEKKEDENQDITMGDQNGGMMVFRRAGRGKDAVFYKDLAKNQHAEKLDFLGRKFIVSGEGNLKWKMTGEQTKILDYICLKAVLQDTSRVVEAWFTPQIPVSSGPGEFGQLPGLILKVEIDSRRSIVATHVNLAPVPAETFKKPEAEKGVEVVTREEFKRIRDKKLQEMQEMNGGGKPDRDGQTVQIRIGN